MPLTLSSPFQKQVSSSNSLKIVWDVEVGQVRLLPGEELPVVEMTAAAFLLAMSTQTGTPKARAWKSYLSAAGLSGTVV